MVSGTTMISSDPGVNGGRPMPMCSPPTSFCWQMTMLLQVVPKSKNRENPRKVFHFTQPSTVASVRPLKMFEGSST